MPFILSQFLEAARWLGALIVLSVHTTNMFLNLGDVMSAPHAAPVYAWWFFSAYQLGHQAVVGFFVMSGYLVGGAALENLRSGKDFLRDYFIHRIARIYVVLIPALVLTFVLDQSGLALFGAAGAYDWPLFENHFTTRIFFQNVFNLQGILAPFYGTNGPLWSLACEFWYYVTFPLLFLPLATNYPRLLRFSGFLLGAAIFAEFALAGGFFRFGFLLWVIGAFARLAPRALAPSRWLALGIYAAVVTVIRLTVRGPVLEAHPWIQDVADVVNAVLFVNLMVTLRFGPDQGWALLKPKLHRTMADFSFSLYSIHMPVLVFLRAAGGRALGPDWTRELATPLHWGVTIAAMAACMGLAYLFAQRTEAHTNTARRFMRKGLDRLTERLGSAVTAMKPGRRA